MHASENSRMTIAIARTLLKRQQRIANHIGLQPTAGGTAHRIDRDLQHLLEPSLGPALCPSHRAHVVYAIWAGASPADRASHFILIAAAALLAGHLARD